VQDDSDGEIRTQLLRENIEGISSSTQKAVTLPTMANGEEDTEGESVLIGEEEAVVSTIA
jgi:hypothetical protein